MGTHVALLRGINVGGKCSLPMRDLTRLFTEAGAANVRTYIQSGNVVFEAEDVSACAGQVTKAIVQGFGYTGRIVLRTAAEMIAAAKSNPFLKAGAPEARLWTYFLADVPSAVDLKTLDPERSAPDAFAVVGREVYLRLPDGMARTKLTNVYFDTKLKTVSTARNWNTVMKLAGMAAE